jgi:DNA-binding CsgD family transcriptional regulator/PAS domain-containing protein
MTTASLLPVVHKLLDAAMDADKWLPFLEQLATAFEAKGAHIVRVPAQERTLAFSALYGFDDVVLRLYGGDGAGRDLAFGRFADHFARLIPSDPRMAMLERYPARPLSCRLHIGAEAMHRSEAYKQLLDIADVEYSLAVSLPEENGATTMVGVFRGKAARHFDEADVARLGELVPFIRHAVSISEHLARVDIQQSWALAALDTLPIGILLASREGRIVQANATAREVLALHDGIEVQNGIVRLESKTQERLLHTAIHKAVARAVHAGAGHAARNSADALTITRPSGKEAFSAVVATLWDNHVKFSLSRLAEPLATLFLGIPEQPLEAPAELLQRLFGLTAAQARLCELLVSGLTVGEAAGRLQVSVATARVHLKKAFENVGVHKQSELIAKILSTPVWLSRIGKQPPPRPPFGLHQRPAGAGVGGARDRVLSRQSEAVGG